MDDRPEHQHPWSAEEINEARWGYPVRQTGNKHRAGRTAGQISQALRDEIAQARAAGALTLPSGAKITAVVARKATPAVIETRVTDLPTDWLTPDAPGGALADQLVGLLADYNDVVYETPGLEQSGQVAWRAFVGHVILQDTTNTTREKAIRAARTRVQAALRVAPSLDRDEAQGLLEERLDQQRQAYDLPPGTTQRRSIGVEVANDITYAQPK